MFKYPDVFTRGNLFQMASKVYTKTNTVTRFEFTTDEMTDWIIAGLNAAGFTITKPDYQETGDAVAYSFDTGEVVRRFLGAEDRNRVHYFDVTDQEDVTST